MVIGNCPQQDWIPVWCSQHSLPCKQGDPHIRQKCWLAVRRTLTFCLLFYLLFCFFFFFPRRSVVPGEANEFSLGQKPVQGKAREGLLSRKRILGWFVFFFFFSCIVLNRISFEGSLVQDRICRALQKENLALLQLLCLSCGLSAWPGSSQALPPQCQHEARSADFIAVGMSFPFPPVARSLSLLLQRSRINTYGSWGVIPALNPLFFLLPGSWAWRRRGWRVCWHISWWGCRCCSCPSLCSGSQSRSCLASSSTSPWPPSMGTSSLRGWLCCSRSRYLQLCLQPQHITGQSVAFSVWDFFLMRGFFWGVLNPPVLSHHLQSTCIL